MKGQVIEKGFAGYQEARMQDCVKVSNYVNQMTYLAVQLGVNPWQASSVGTKEEWLVRRLVTPVWPSWKEKGSQEHRDVCKGHLTTQLRLQTMGLDETEMSVRQFIEDIKKSDDIWFEERWFSTSFTADGY